MEKILRNKVSFNDSGMEKTGSIDNKILCIVHQLLNKTTESKLDWNIEALEGVWLARWMPRGPLTRH